MRRVELIQSRLSDYSDGYDSSDDEWQRARSRRQSMAGQKAPPPQQRQQQNREWASLDDDASSIHRGGLLDPNDPFGDPFADDNDTPLQERQRMQCKLSLIAPSVLKLINRARGIDWSIREKAFG